MRQIAIQLKKKGGRMFKKLLFVFMLLIIISITAFGQDYCEVLPPPGSPGGDSPDDNFSFSNGNTTQYSFGNKCLIYMNGYFKEANKLFGGNYFEITYSVEQLLKSSSVLIFPSGGLFGLENDSTLKATLQEYVRQGGVILVLAQQFGAHIDKVVPIPEGESLRSYGFREDQSCSGYAGYFKQMHPALASMPVLNAYINVDGYFASYPCNATVILRRITNNQPCLLSYPYGNGTVILTSMYSDWGAAHSQTSAEELRLVRDLITFAKNPKLVIPMYNLTTNPHPDISLNVTVKNDTETAAARVKVKVYTPDRAMVLFETESSLALAAGDEGVIPISFNLITTTKYGICHTDYELYDADGKNIQLATEADSGRFVS